MEVRLISKADLSSILCYEWSWQLTNIDSPGVRRSNRIEKKTSQRPLTLFAAVMAPKQAQNKWNNEPSIFHIAVHWNYNQSFLFSLFLYHPTQFTLRPRLSSNRSAMRCYSKSPWPATRRSHSRLNAKLKESQRQSECRISLLFTKSIFHH